MTTIDRRIDESGTLIRDGGAFYLRRDLGGRNELELRLIGILVTAGIVSADGVAPA